MSEENVEIVRRVTEVFMAAMRRGDPGAVFDTDAIAPDAEWVTPEFDGARRVWRGREASWRSCAPGPRTSRTGR
jgi:hypothetical protein